MGYRYCSPPNWPPPPTADWLPPDGWKPDPAWPPAPDGWSFWVEDPGFTGSAGGVATAVRATPVKENRARAQLRQQFTASLEPGEELRWFTVTYQYKAPRFIVGLFAWSIVLPLIGPLVAMILRRPWSLGVTSTRVLVGPFQYGLGNKDKAGELRSVPLSDVAVLRKGRTTGNLIVTNPVEGLPTTFTLQRGKNVDELEALLHA